MKSRPTNQCLQWSKGSLGFPDAPSQLGFVSPKHTTLLSLHNQHELVVLSYRSVRTFTGFVLPSWDLLLADWDLHRCHHGSVDRRRSRMWYLPVIIESWLIIARAISWSLLSCVKNSKVFLLHCFSDHRVVKKTFEFLAQYSKFHEMTLAISTQLSILT
jgi:hypothetical protein